MILKELIDEFRDNTAINIHSTEKRMNDHDNFIVTSCTGVIGSDSVISDEKLNSEIAWIEYDNAILNIGIWAE